MKKLLYDITVGLIVIAISNVLGFLYKKFIKNIVNYFIQEPSYRKSVITFVLQYLPLIVCILLVAFKKVSILNPIIIGVGIYYLVLFSGLFYIVRTVNKIIKN